MAAADPLVVHKFLVEINPNVVASFSECSGLQFETEFDEVQEGGENGFRHKLPKGSRYGNVTLRRGLTHSDELWRWYEARLAGDLTVGEARRRSVAVILWDADRADAVWRWQFHNAYPVKWNGPELKADASAVAIETLELAHGGLVLAGTSGLQGGGGF